MISNEKIKLLELWAQNPFRELSIAEVMLESKKKTKTWVFNALKVLVKNNILNSTRKSNLNIYTLNSKNPLSLQFLQYLDTQKNLNFQQLKVVSEIIEKIPIKNCSILIFGSYVVNKQKKNSDLDVCILIENKDVERKIKPYIQEVKLNHPLKIDEYYITFEDFVKMLLHEEENLAKQIFIKHRLFYNNEIYYQLLKAAHKNGFRP